MSEASCSCLLNEAKVEDVKEKKMAIQMSSINLFWLFKILLFFLSWFPPTQLDNVHFLSSPKSSHIHPYLLIFQFPVFFFLPPSLQFVLPLYS